MEGYRERCNGKKELDQIKKSQDVERECEKGSALSHR